MDKSDFTKQLPPLICIRLDVCKPSFGLFEWRKVTVPFDIIECTTLNTDQRKQMRVV